MGGGGRFVVCLTRVTALDAHVLALSAQAISGGSLFTVDLVHTYATHHGAIPCDRIDFHAIVISWELQTP